MIFAMVVKAGTCYIQSSSDTIESSLLSRPHMLLKIFAWPLTLCFSLSAMTFRGMGKYSHFHKTFKQNL